MVTAVTKISKISKLKMVKKELSVKRNGLDDRPGIQSSRFFHLHASSFQTLSLTREGLAFHTRF
jgi:hypothetical protein